MMFFYEIEVLSLFQRRGIATSLINRLKSICRGRNIGKMFVLTDCRNNAAQALYRQTGGIEEYNDGVLFVYSDPTGSD